MGNTRLQIGTNTNVGVFDNIPANISYQISDVRNPSQRKGTFSKTISLPGSKEVNLLFENIFEANVSLQTFNPTLKTDASYYVDEIPVFVGYLQLLNINKNETTGLVTYECSLIGELKTLFTDIEGLYLTDLWNNTVLTAAGQDFDNYSYTLNDANVVAGFSNTSGDGRAFPLIDWGYNNSNVGFMKPQDFRCCFFAWGYLYRIFLAQGYTWTSSFLDGTFFKKLIIPPTKDTELTETVLNNNKFLYNADGTQNFAKSLTYSVGFLTYSETSWSAINFQTLVYDNATLFVTPTYTVATSNYHNMKANISFKVVITNSGGDQSALVTPLSGAVEVGLFKNGNLQSVNSIPVSSLTLGAAGSNNVLIDLPNVNLVATDTYDVRIRFSSITMSTALPTSTWTLTATPLTGSNFSSEFSSKQVYYGQTVSALDVIPENVKQTDFLSSIIKMFNLYVMVDPSNPKNYIIEPRDAFYTNTSEDWTYKHDENTNIEITPLGELNFSTFKYRYKEDKDYFNTIHQAEYLEPYGSYDKDIDNDFVSGELTTSLIFSPTPSAKAPFVNIVVPTIIKKDNLTISPTPCNIRILYFSGLVTPSQPCQWTFLGGTGTTVYSQQPMAGMTDNHFAPSIDLGWGFPDKVYYTYPNQTWTTKNLYNYYYSRYINQISDKNSKLVTAYFYLTPNDINKFDFRNPIFWKDAYYIVNKIEYNPLIESTSKVELLKLTDYDEFSPQSIEFSGGLGSGTGSYNRTAGGGLESGDNNLNQGTASMIMGGSDNYIAPNADSVTLINSSDVVVFPDASNVTLINVSDAEVTSDWNDSVIVGSNPSISITSDTTLSALYNERTVYLDATGGDITITWDMTVNEDMNIYFIRKDNSANTIYITATGSGGLPSYFIGNSMPYDLGLTQYEAIPLTSKDDTIYIRA